MGEGQNNRRGANKRQRRAKRTKGELTIVGGGKITEGEPTNVIGELKEQKGS